MAFQLFIQSLKTKGLLSKSDAETCMDRILDGAVTTPDLKELLTALNDAQITVDELVGFATSMRAHATKVVLPGEAIDICGSGGTGKDRFNVSTAAAFVLASAGVGVAKHGNRGSAKPNGSFDFLEALGIKFDFSVDKIPDMFSKTHLGFLFARNHHPAMRHVVQARKELGVRTVFNLLGPLANPARVSRQIIGTTDAKTAMLFASALQKLGIKRALISVASDGIDEVTTTGTTQFWDVRPDSISQFEFDPKSLGLRASTSEIEGGLADENAKLFTHLMANKVIDHPISQMIALNAGVAFFCVDRVTSIEEGYALALERIASSGVWDLFCLYRKLSLEN